MNEFDIAALNKAVQLERCWQGVILCPSADGSGEFNLLGKEAQPFRLTKCAVKAGENVSHSRQRMSGIRIPTLFPAVVSEWWNVKTQISTWAWNGGVPVLLPNIIKVKDVAIFSTKQCAARGASTLHHHHHQACKRSPHFRKYCTKNSSVTLTFLPHA